MQEEIGLQADRMEKIGGFLLTPGGADEFCHLFVGRVAAPATGPDGIAGYGGLASENEDIRIRVWPAAAAIEAAFAGRFINSVTCLGLFWLAAKRDWLRQNWRDL
jgi:ADP-ribose pyrophosphatase